MKRLLWIFIIAAAALVAVPSVRAGSWIFQRSYYTHDPVKKVRIGPQASGGPYYSPVQGHFVRSGVRRLHSQIRVGGMVFDQYNEWDAWIQTGAQF